jgi:hypothetical protein
MDSHGTETIRPALAERGVSGPGGRMVMHRVLQTRVSSRSKCRFDSDPGLSTNQGRPLAGVALSFCESIFARNGDAVKYLIGVYLDTCCLIKFQRHGAEKQSK